MRNSTVTKALTLSLILVLVPVGSALAAFGAGAGGNEQGYDAAVRFYRTVTGDVLKLLPRAMASYIYQNREDFQRGVTFALRNIDVNPLKMKDLEEMRREAYARLMRDIPYCVEAFKGGEIKLDTSASNLAGRLGMIVFNISILKLPMLPDLTYQERFATAFIEAVIDSQIDIWLFYDGYGDFHSLGELMERLRPAGMPTFKHVRYDEYAAKVKDDTYFMFRAPDKFEKTMVATNVDLNEVYNTVINDTLDAFVYIWKCSGMDLAHPSYAAPPGTVITRGSRRSMTMTVAGRRGGAVHPPKPVDAAAAAAEQAGPTLEGGPGATPEAGPGGEPLPAAPGSESSSSPSRVFPPTPAGPESE